MMGDLPLQPSFATHFFGPNEAGLETLQTKLKTSKHISEEIVGMLKERAAIEEEYAKRLSKLNKNFAIKEEIGTMKDALEVLKAEIETSARVHAEMGSDIRIQLEKPLIEFTNSQSLLRKNVYAGLDKIQKQKAALAANVLKSKERYESKCSESVSLAQLKASSTLAPKEYEKIRVKLEKTQSAVCFINNPQANSADFDYMAGVEKLNDLHKKWKIESLKGFAQFQKLEEERLDFLRSHICMPFSNLGTFANLVSTVCVADDEGCERLRCTLEKCDIKHDIELFCKTASTGTDIAPPLKYVNFYTGEGEKISAPFAASISSLSPPLQNVLNNSNIGSAPTTNGSVEELQASPRELSSSPNDTYIAYDPYDIPDTAPLFQVRVIYDYTSQAYEEMSIQKGQVLDVLVCHSDGWWETIGQEAGRKRKGLVPSNFVVTI